MHVSTCVYTQADYFGRLLSKREAAVFMTGKVEEQGDGEEDADYGCNGHEKVNYANGP
jgi:hypothetical protein